ncbi:MAG TPA: S-layer homology domain-containing protein [bacterium]|nr:S-layer homology domain-containing protein [bacterium]
MAIPCLTFGHAVFAQTVPILVTTDVSAIASAGIINHHDNLADYELDRTITRRETAKIIYRLKAVMNDLSPDTPAQCESLYSDILASDWGCGYISTLARSGIFSLRNTSFRPDDTVSRYEMILIVARLLSEQARAFQGSGASVTVFMDTLINYGVLDASESTMLLNNVNDNLYVPASRSFSFALVERALSTLKTDLWDNGPDMPEEDVYLDDIFGEDLSGDM